MDIDPQIMVLYQTHNREFRCMVINDRAHRLSGRVGYIKEIVRQFDRDAQPNGMWMIDLPPGVTAQQLEPYGEYARGMIIKTVDA